MSERKNLLDVFDPPEVRPDPGTIREIETLRNLLRYMQEDVERVYPERIQRLEYSLEVTRNALNDVRDRVIPNYEARIEALLEERDLGLRSDRRPVDTKTAPGAHGAYR